MTEYSHVHPSAHHYFQLSDEDRLIACSNDFWVGHPNAEHLIKRLLFAMKMRDKVSAPCVLVTAPGGVGKTALIQELKVRNENSIDKMIFVTMHQSPNGYSLKDLILSELGVGVGRHARRGHNITPEMQSIIKAKNIRGIVIDEIHDAITLTESQQRVNLSLLKNLSGSAYGLSVFAFGVPDAATVLGQDPQLQRRYPVVELRGWDNGTDFRNFVATYIHYLPLKKKTNFNDPGFFQLINKLGLGITDNVVKILQACAMASIEDQSEHITRQHLNNVDEIMSSFYFALRRPEVNPNDESESYD